MLNGFHSQPLVTVIIPAFNHSAYVIDALESVFCQTYSNIELILLDDQSKDNTVTLAQDWAKQKIATNRFSRIVVESNPVNLGAHDTINRGLSMANGTWLTILNSDDRYLPTRIEQLVNASVNNQAELLFTGVHVIDDQNNRYQGSSLAAEIESAVDLADISPSLSFALLKKNIAISSGNLFFSKQLVDKIGGFKSLKYCHDWDFILRACLSSEPMMISAPLYEYRIHGSNSFSSLKLEQFLETQAVYRSYFSRLSAGNCQNPLAPSSINWPGLYDRVIPEDKQLSGAYYLVGHDLPKYDHIGRMVQQMYTEH